MAALRHLNVRGMRVEVWETSFRIEGMAQAIHCGAHLNDQQVIQTINTIYDHVRSHAERSAEDRVLNHINRKLETLIRRTP